MYKSFRFDSPIIYLSRNFFFPFLAEFFPSKKFNNRSGKQTRLGMIPNITKHRQRRGTTGKKQKRGSHQIYLFIYSVDSWYYVVMCAVDVKRLLKSNIKLRSYLVNNCLLMSSPGNPLLYQWGFTWTNEIFIVELICERRWLGRDFVNDFCDDS